MTDLPIVAISYSAGETAVIQSLLQWNGIFAVVLDHNTMHLWSNRMLGLGGFRIAVARSDFVEAALMLHAAQNGPSGRVVTLRRITAWTRLRDVVWFLLGALPPPRVALTVARLSRAEFATSVEVAPPTA